jgi:hypothetical protein
MEPVELHQLLQRFKHPDCLFHCKGKAGIHASYLSIHTFPDLIVCCVDIVLMLEVFVSRTMVNRREKIQELAERVGRAR